jgi:hypothetical protein
MFRGAARLARKVGGLASSVVFLAACGPTGQIHVEQHLLCDADGTNCQMVAYAQRDYTASDRFWQVLLTVLANGVGGHH